MRVPFSSTTQISGVEEDEFMVRTLSSEARDDAVPEYELRVCELPV